MAPQQKKIFSRDAKVAEITVLGESPVNEFYRFGSAELVKHDFKCEEDHEHATIRQQDLQTKHVFIQPGLRYTTFLKTQCVHGPACVCEYCWMEFK